MVKWSSYYHFSAEDVEALGVEDRASGTHPCVLNVFLRSGNKLSVSYHNNESRKAAMLDLCRQIEREKRYDMEKIHNDLYILRDAVSRIDKRQLRIWRQLKALLGVEVEDADNGTA